jgi:hypothetical protein
LLKVFSFFLYFFFFSAFHLVFWEIMGQRE